MKIPSSFVALLSKKSGFMGSIVFWGIIRTAIFIPVAWFLTGYIEFRYWWAVFPIALYAVIIQPAVIQYKLFMEENRETIYNSLCSSCNFFDETAVICLKLDKHPSRDFLPCEGLEWEPKNERNIKEETDS